MPEQKQKREELIDSTSLRHELTATYKKHGKNESKLRTVVLERLKEVMQEGRERVKARFFENGKGRECAENLSYLQDELIRVLYDFTNTHVYRAKNPSSAERLCVVAVGGYGRGTLAPESDIDLLFLRPYKETAWSESFIEYLLYMLWDMGFKVGHATRSTQECIRLAKTDITIRTALLEARYLWGDQPLFDELQKDFDEKLVSQTASEFIEEKLEERDIRHSRSGETRYLVEPNIKDGKGGQRDLQTLFWIGKYVYRVQTEKELVKAGVFNRSEYLKFMKCDHFLWSARCHLHYLTGRGEERLTFDVQPEIANLLEYQERAGLSSVERFMKHYFLIAKDIGDLTRIFCAALEASQVKKPRTMRSFINKLGIGGGPQKLLEGFKIDGERLNIEHDNVFKDDPVNLLRFFYLADKHDILMHPRALQWVTRSLRLVDKSLRENKEANRLFLEILCSKNDPESMLRKMNEAGLLGKFMLDFGRIVSLMQFNMYHHYTVDEHLLRAVGILSKIDKGELEEEHPLAHGLIKKIKNRRALFVAVLLHDVAKGRKEDHSIAGERVAKKLCPRLGLSAAETETVAWLVREHLVMSDFAQMRDLNDYKTILDFSEIIQSPERLKLLLILTVCDIKAVGPGVWNGWKGQLLRTLYFEAEPVLSGGHTAVSRSVRVKKAHEKFLEGWETDWNEVQKQGYVERHSPAYWTSVSLDRQIEHANLIKECTEKGEGLASSFSTDRFQSITVITIYTLDHPRLLAVLTGACAAAGANIVDAQIFTTKDGMALDTIFIQREFTEGEDEARRAERVTQMIEDTLKGEIHLPEAVKDRAKTPARIKAFKVEPEVIIDNDSSNTFTLIEVNGRDRPGLLYDLTDALSRLNLNISSAHIATFGERAVDVFYVKDMLGLKVVHEGRQEKITTELLAALGDKRTRAKEDAEEVVVQS